MSELLPEFDGEQEAIWRFSHPPGGNGGIGRPIKRTVDFNCVEKSTVIFQLVGCAGRVKISVPSALTLGIRPPGSAYMDFVVIRHIFRFCACGIRLYVR